LTCFHFSEGGFPPNTWADKAQGTRNKAKAVSNLFIDGRYGGKIFQQMSYIQSKKISCPK